MKSTSALTIAEGSPRHKVDVSLVIGGSIERKHIVRTAYDSLSVWKSKYDKNVSSFLPRPACTVKNAAIIDDEVWLFGVDSTNYQNIVDSVVVGSKYYNVPTYEIMRNVYVKNLNTERENLLENDVLIQSNIDLYQTTTEAIKQAARVLAVEKEIKFFVFSSEKNPKIPGKSLRQALLSGGADSIERDRRIHLTSIGTNDGEKEIIRPNNLFMASL